MRLRASQQVASTVVGAAAVFAPTSFARLRLIRQLHACGLLTDSDARVGTTRELAAATRPGGAPPAVDEC